MNGHSGRSDDFLSISVNFVFVCESQQSNAERENENFSNYIPSAERENDEVHRKEKEMNEKEKKTRK